MALITNQNLYALSGQNNLGINQLALGKSIERLSSGLRINHAADDASGMAISEKMRGQISGLKRASMNAQDGISYLQTAEGAMEQTSSILQRMRELAVQAANGIYTTNDRAEIQKEVDQLKAEIDRVSTSAEFNTRKLLNGDGTAIWSADTNRIKAIIRGPVSEANYQLQMDVRPGKSEILKTDIMRLQDGKIAVEITTATRTNTTNVGGVSNPDSIATGTYTVTVGNTASATTEAGRFLGGFQGSGSSWGTGPVAVATPNSILRSGYLEVEMLESDTDVATMDYRYRFIDPETGDAGNWIAAVNANAAVLEIRGVHGDIDIPITSTNITQGDKMLLAVDRVVVANVDIAAGGGTVQLTGPNGEVGPTIVFDAADSLTQGDNGDHKLDSNNIDVFVATINSKTGNVNIGNVVLSFRENTTATIGSTAGSTVAGLFDIDILGSGGLATPSTKLKDIDIFVDADGNGVFDQKQELTIYANGNKAVVHIEGNDSIATLVEKLNKAIVQDLKMGSDDPNVNSNLVRYISVPDPSGWGTIKGTFIIQSALTGENSEMAFIGNQSLIDALSLAQVQKPTNNETTVTIRDAHTGNLIGTETTGDDRVYTLIEGVEVKLDSRAGVQSSWDHVHNTIVYASNAAMRDQRYHLHLVDNRTSLQVGANKGQDLDVSIPQLDLEGLGLENVTMVSQDYARIAIGKIDNALTRVVSARATIGAQVSRLEHTIQNLSTTRQNLINAESRIRDLDVAEESTNLARNQVLVQSGVAMLAQANQIPQLALQLIQG